MPAAKACIKKEGCISSDASKIPIWVVPTNEEIVVARECAKLLRASVTNSLTAYWQFLT